MIYIGFTLEMQDRIFPCRETFYSYRFHAFIDSIRRQRGNVLATLRDTPEVGRGAKEHCVLGNKILVSEMFRIGM